MSNTENSRIQRDAQRAVTHRNTTGSPTDQAVLRHLGVELYKEIHRTEVQPEEAEASVGTADNGTAGPGDGPAVPGA